ncbi:hypothetical protein GCM10009539_69440 [Cryptosporangium japonicum]|uniref:Uncharacterized protein n=1 Tax=Cryptosporangium japonicum TaxID=80872 RepID=A0ABP3EP47_9ACTN
MPPASTISTAPTAMQALAQEGAFGFLGGSEVKRAEAGPGGSDGVADRASSRPTAITLPSVSRATARG